MDSTNPPALGAFPDATGVRFAVRSTTATRVWISLFDPPASAKPTASK